MSFSQTVKEELCRLEKVKSCCLTAELSAALKLGGTVRKLTESDSNIKIVTENAAFARRTFTLVKELYGISPEIMAKKSSRLKKHVSYTIIITPQAGSGRIIEETGKSLKKLLKDNCCRRSFLRGAFLASGSVSDPEKTYHLEITTRNKKTAGEIAETANNFGLNAKQIRRKGAYVVYMKEGENIVDFFNIIGAHHSLMTLENVRILKEMRNSVNRLVNCETANLDKTVNASVRQIENIKFVRDNIGFDNIPVGLREIAKLRLRHKDLNLKELGEMLDPVLGKSGVNHRLRKLECLAENFRGQKR